MHLLTIPRLSRRAIAAAAVVAFPASANASIVLSQAVVDIMPAADAAQDIEIHNDGSDISYVVVEPSEIVAPGTPEEKRIPVVDPGVGGLLVSPQRLVLQPGERKVVRVAAIAARGTVDRIYRVTVKPVAGPVTAPVSALKLLVGYDVLVIYRPAVLAPKLVGERSGTTLILRNQGNTNVEVYEGKQCDGATPAVCKTLPSHRLYAGQSWQQALTGTGTVTYRVATGTTSSIQQFM